MLKWSWRESNPRPNTLQKCFLHAYPLFDFRLMSGKRLSRTKAYPLKFHFYIEADKNYPCISDASYQTPQRKASGETAYCLSLTKQLKQNYYFRHLFWHES